MPVTSGIVVTERTPASTKAEYRYNGLGQRVAYKLNGTGTWYDLVQDEQWREVAVYDRTNNKLLERTLFHNAGLNGRSGSSYIDSCAVRETSPTTGTYPVMQTRWYTLQNWRADVVATLASNGTLSAWSSYTAYGKQQTWRVADIDDGTETGTPDEGVTIEDLTLYLAWFEAGDPQADVDDGSGTGALDAGVTIEDLAFFLTYFEGSGGDFDSRLGYAGYVKDEADSRQSGLYHVRFRVYSTELGSWLTQDPLEWESDEFSLYRYAHNNTMTYTDPSGLIITDERYNCRDIDKPTKSPTNPPTAPIPDSPFKTCVYSCLSDYANPVVLAACIVTSPFTPTAKGPNERVGRGLGVAEGARPPSKYTNWYRRLFRYFDGPGGKLLGRAAHKLGVVGAIVDSATCSYLAGVLISCTTICAIDPTPF